MVIKDSTKFFSSSWSLYLGASLVYAASEMACDIIAKTANNLGFDGNFSTCRVVLYTPGILTAAIALLVAGVAFVDHPKGTMELLGLESSGPEKDFD